MQSQNMTLLRSVWESALLGRIGCKRLVDFAPCNEILYIDMFSNHAKYGILSIHK